MQNSKFLFVGNRFYVLNEMLKMGLNITKIYAVKESFLEKELARQNVSYTLLPEKREFLSELRETDFDVLISNGCPYILPVSGLSFGKRKFVNIHPSLLPDLKGKNPINGALLFNRRHGVTCHYMDDGIDTGKVIEQLEIPVTDDINLDLLYQISFRAEGMVFKRAYENAFRIKDARFHRGEYIYYTKKESDRNISLNDSAEMVLRKVKAFGSVNQYACFIHNEKIIEAVSAVKIENEIVRNLFQTGSHNVIKAVYGDRYVLVEFDGMLIQFQLHDISSFETGDVFIG